MIRVNCPSCRRPLEGEPIGRGEYAICVGCLRIAAMGNDGTLRPLTPEARKALPASLQVEFDVTTMRLTRAAMPFGALDSISIDQGVIEQIAAMIHSATARPIRMATPVGFHNLAPDTPGNYATVIPSGYQCVFAVGQLSLGCFRMLQVKRKDGQPLGMAAIWLLGRLFGFEGAPIQWATPCCPRLCSITGIEPMFDTSVLPTITAPGGSA